MSTKNYKNQEEIQDFFEIDNFIIFANWKKKPNDSLYLSSRNFDTFYKTMKPHCEDWLTQN